MTTRRKKKSQDGFLKKVSSLFNLDTRIDYNNRNSLSFCEVNSPRNDLALTLLRLETRVKFVADLKPQQGRKALPIQSAIEIVAALPRRSLPPSSPPPFPLDPPTPTLIPSPPSTLSSYSSRMETLEIALRREG
uniref:Uncharacterized protein n=1 Tax=Vespula pensylvanica TaxID=30213 RepID=A0A834PDF5_VESPE|nr:hypothetical protein H0235_000129 [Vespula pensylvanica]